MKTLLGRFTAALLAAAGIALAFGYHDALLKAASPPSGTLSSTGGPISWNGFDAAGVSPEGETTCVEGTNCDTFILTIAPGDYTGKRVRFKVTWANELNDYDVYVHAGSNAGPVVTRAADGAPETVEENTWDLNRVVAADETYTVRTVYFAVAPGDPYHGVLQLEQIPSNPSRTATHIKADKSGLKFSKNRTVYAPAATRDGEPSIRVSYQGVAFVGAIRGLTGGNDLWRFDLNTDPFLKSATPTLTSGGFGANPAWKGQPDAIAPNNEEDLGGDGGGDMDIAVGFKPSAPNPTGPPIVATTSLVAANISSQRSTDNGETFTNNPAGNTTVPVDDRQWNEFYGGDVVYLGYRELVGLQATARFYINRSEDGGLTYGPAVHVNATSPGGNLVGNIDVDQNDGTVYFCYQGPGTAGNKQVKISVGRPVNPNVAPVLYETFIAATAEDNIGHIFPVCKVAKDSTVYVAYSDGGKNIFLVHSTDHGRTWSQPVRVSDMPAQSAAVMPWIETGDAPGSLAIVWYGAEPQDSEDGSGGNDNESNWKVFFAQTLNAKDQNPTFYQIVASDHFIHGSNISTSGLVVGGQSPNRNLLDFFQVAIDPQGLAVIAYTDDSNDFTGHTYVTRQTAGFSLNTGTAVTVSGDDSDPPRDPSLPEVLDFRHDARLETRPPAVPDEDLASDITSIDYACEFSGGKTFLAAALQASGLNSVPLDSFWRINFASNPTKPGLSDRADQWFLIAETDLSGTPTYSYGTAVRNTDGSITYTKRGAADFGAFDSGTRSVTMKIDVAKLNALQTRGLIGDGTTFIGLRGSSVTNRSAANPQTSGSSVDTTRGGTSFTLAPDCFGVAPSQPDLLVTDIVASNNRAREGDKVSITATISNTGTANAGASRTEFLLDGTTLLGLVDTPAILQGGSAQVSVNWDTRSTKGEHTIRVTADKTVLVPESNESNNSASRTVTVQGNKVKNGSFEQANASGTGPDAWTGSDTGAGSTSWAEGGSDGSRSAAIAGNGGSATVSGSPAWVSEPITVTPGRVVDLVISVQSTGASSAASAGVIYLGAAGEVLNTATVLIAPLTTAGFTTLEQAVTIPAGVAQVQIKLFGFAATDVSTSGTVVFDSIGLYER
jgi:hypothetical protein